MGFGASSLFMKINLILLILTLVIHLLGLALPHWVVVDTNNLELNFGLWRTCHGDKCSKIDTPKALPHWVVVDTNNLELNFGLWRTCHGDKCSKIDTPKDWLKASRAFAIISLLVLIAALVCTIVVVFVKNDMKILKLVAWILAIVAAFCVMIEFAVYVDETDAWDEYYSGALALEIIAFVLCIVIGILGVIDWLGKGK